MTKYICHRLLIQSFGMMFDFQCLRNPNHFISFVNDFPQTTDLIGIIYKIRDAISCDEFENREGLNLGTVCVYTTNCPNNIAGLISEILI